MAEMETLAGSAEFEQVIKKSRFLARAGRCRDETAAMAFVEQAGDPDCRHNCWAFRAGDVYRFDDAGEPGGTAGQPILQAIDNQGLDQVVVVVSRWFGGIRLGAGGLVRAYGGTAAECLRLASRRKLVHRVGLRILAPFASIDSVHHLMERHDAVKQAENYTATGVEMTLQLPERMRGKLIRELNEVTRGQVHIHEQGATETGEY